MSAATAGADVRGTVVELLLRLSVAGAALVDAVVHWRLADGYANAFPAGVGGGAVFRAEAVAAVLVAVAVLALGNRVAWGAAVVVLGSAFVAVVLYRYVDVPTIGPLPGMYEPIWYGEKTLSAVAEGVGAALAAVGLARRTKREKRAVRA